MQRNNDKKLRATGIDLHNLAKDNHFEDVEYITRVAHLSLQNVESIETLTNADRFLIVNNYVLLTRARAKLQEQKNNSDWYNDNTLCEYLQKACAEFLKIPQDAPEGKLTKKIIEVIFIHALLANIYRNDLDKARELFISLETRLNSLGSDERLTLELGLEGDSQAWLEKMRKEEFWPEWKEKPFHRASVKEDESSEEDNDHALHNLLVDLEERVSKTADVIEALKKQEPSRALRNDYNKLIMAKVNLNESVAGIISKKRLPDPNNLFANKSQKPDAPRSTATLRPRSSN